MQNFNLEDKMYGVTQSIKKRDFNHSIKLCNEILDVEPNHIPTFFSLYQIALESKQTNLAIDFLKKIINLDDKHKNSLLLLSELYIKQKDNNIASKYLKELENLDVQEPEILNNMGIFFKKIGDLKKSENCFLKAIKNDTFYSISYNNLGLYYLEKSNYKYAKKYLEFGYKIDVTNIAIVNNLSTLYEETGLFQKSFEILKEIYKLEPNSFVLNFNLARKYSICGEFKKSEFHFLKCLKINPSNLKSLFEYSNFNLDLLKNIEIKNLETLTENSESSDNKVYGNFLIAKKYNIEREYKKEINFYLKGKNEFYKLNQKRFKQFKIYYTKGNESKIKKLNKISCKNPSLLSHIFIVGVPRCGSTLIEKIIGTTKSKNFQILEEISVFHYLVNKKKEHLKKLTTIDILKIYKEKNVKFNMYNEFTDKSLENFKYIELILNFFPNAKIINCERNPKSSIISIIKHHLNGLPWAQKFEDILDYFDHYYSTIKKNKKRFSKNIYNLNFERFTANFDYEVNQLYDFCDLKNFNVQDMNSKKIFSKTASNFQIRQPIHNKPSGVHKYDFLFKNLNKKYSWLK